MRREHSQSLFEWEFTNGYSGVGGVCTADFLPRSCSPVRCGKFGPKNRCLLSRVPGSTFHVNSLTLLSTGPRPLNPTLILSRSWSQRANERVIGREAETYYSE